MRADVFVVTFLKSITNKFKNTKSSRIVKTVHVKHLDSYQEDQKNLDNGGCQDAKDLM